MEQREQLIQLEKDDSYRYGFEPGNWKDADELWKGCGELLIQGGNRAGKSEFAAKRIVQMMTAKKGAKVWVLGMTAQSSIRDQQQLVYKYIPTEWKNIKKGRVQNVSFSQKNGFTENTFVLPNGSQCWFMNYSQEMRVIEGGEVDMIWCDELVPLPWIETLRFRLVTRAASHDLSGRLHPHGEGIFVWIPGAGDEAESALARRGECSRLPGWNHAVHGSVPPRRREVNVVLHRHEPV